MYVHAARERHGDNRQHPLFFPGRRAGGTATRHHGPDCTLDVLGNRIDEQMFPSRVALGTALLIKGDLTLWGRQRTTANEGVLLNSTHINVACIALKLCARRTPRSRAVCPRGLLGSQVANPGFPVFETLLSFLVCCRHKHFEIGPRNNPTQAKRNGKGDFSLSLPFKTYLEEAVARLQKLPNISSKGPTPPAARFRCDVCSRVASGKHSSSAGKHFAPVRCSER